MSVCALPPRISGTDSEHATGNEHETRERTRTRITETQDVERLNEQMAQGIIKRRKKIWRSIVRSDEDPITTARDIESGVYEQFHRAHHGTEEGSDKLGNDGSSPSGLGIGFGGTNELGPLVVTAGTGKSAHHARSHAHSHAHSHIDSHDHRHSHSQCPASIPDASTQDQGQDRDQEDDHEIPTVGHFFIPRNEIEKLVGFLSEDLMIDDPYSSSKGTRQLRTEDDKHYLLQIDGLMKRLTSTGPSVGIERTVGRVEVCCQPHDECLMGDVDLTQLTSRSSDVHDHDHEYDHSHSHSHGHRYDQGHDQHSHNDDNLHDNHHHHHHGIKAELSTETETLYSPTADPSSRTVSRIDSGLSSLDPLLDSQPLSQGGAGWYTSVKSGLGGAYSSLTNGAARLNPANLWSADGARSRSRGTGSRAMYSQNNATMADFSVGSDVELDSNEGQWLEGLGLPRPHQD